MRKAEQVIFAVMTMVSDGQGNVLMQHRVDPGWPGYAFPGGHVEQGESFADTAIREIWEETGIRIAHPVLCGVKHYPLDSGVRYVVLLYRNEGAFSGEVRGSEEGDAMWVPQSQMAALPLADGFAEMYQLFIRDDVSELWYDQTETGQWTTHFQ